MVQALNHIGVAVRSLQEALPVWIDGMGLRLEGIEEVPTEKVRVAMLYAGDTRVELIEPTAADSPIQAFLDKRGPGIHHLAFTVEDAQESIDHMTARGLPLLDRKPRPGAHGTKVAFVHPKGLGGVLAEIVEEPRG